MRWLILSPDCFFHYQKLLINDHLTVHENKNQFNTVGGECVQLLICASIMPPLPPIMSLQRSEPPLL